MAEPMTPDEMADQIEQAKYIAAQRRDEYNAAQALTSQPPAAGPPPPPAAKPAGWGPVKNAAAKAAILGGSALIGGPLGLIAGQSINEASDKSGAVPDGPPKAGEWDPRSGIKPPTQEEKDLKAADPNRPAAAQGTTYDPVIDMTGDDAGGGRPRLVTPAGMRPDSNMVQVHQGRQAPDVTKMAIGESAKLESEGVEAARLAERDYQQDAAINAQLKADADKEAADQAAAERAQRKQMFDERMARIQSLNDEATSKIDPDRFWHDRGNLARALGAIGVALGEVGSKLNGGPNNAMAILENAINRDIDAQKANKSGKKDESNRQLTLLELNMKESDGRLSGIDATKAAYWKTADTMLQMAAARRGVSMADANAMQMQAGIASKLGASMNAVSLQEQDDINKTGVEKWQNAVYSGGKTGKGGSDHKNVITIPAFDGSGKQMHVSVHDKDYEPMQQVVRATAKLVETNTRGVKARQDYRDAWAAWRADPANPETVSRLRGCASELDAIQDARTALSEKQKDPNSAIKEAEYDRAARVTINFKDGLPGYNVTGNGAKDVDARVSNNSNQAVSSLQAQAAFTGGQVVRPARVLDKEGNPDIKFIGTGRLYQAPPITPSVRKSEAK